MSSNIAPAVEALSDEITRLLGPPRPQKNGKIRIWSGRGVEVAVQCDVGPHVWVPGQIRLPGDPFRGLDVEHYPPNRSRHSGLRTTRTLSPGHSADRISNAGEDISAVIRGIREYAEAAGVVKREGNSDDGRPAAAI